MALPPYTAEPGKRAKEFDRPQRIWGALLLAGGLGGLVMAVWHPRGPALESAAEFAAWTTVHVFGALGFGIIATAALLHLASGNAPNRMAAVGLAALTVFGTLTMIATAVDGFLTPTLAAIADEPGTAALMSAFLSVERALGSFGFSGFGITAAVVTIAHLPRMGTAMRIAAGVGIVGLLAFAGAGILYIGLELESFVLLFAGTGLWSLWFVVWGAWLAFARVKTPDAAHKPATRTA